jgi:DNA mismatch repair protein MutS
MLALYNEFCDQAQKKFGSSAFAFIQVGSFFEIYGDHKNSTALKIASDILQLSVVQRSEKNGYWIAGLPMCSIDKFSKILLKNNYTVVLITDVEKSNNKTQKNTKQITKVISPSCRITDSFDNLYQTEEDTSILVSILLYIANKSEHKLCLSFSNTDNGKLTVIPMIIEDDLNVLYEKCSEILKTISGLCEVLLSVVYESDEIEISEDMTKSKCGVRGILTHYKTYTLEICKNTFLDSGIFQKTAMERYFKNHQNIYQDIFKNIGISQGHEVGNLILMLTFLENHGEIFVTNLELPEQLNYSSDRTETFLKCYNGVFEKMHIFSRDSTNKQSIFENLNRTRTSAGKQLFGDYMRNPITDCEKLNARYEIVECIKNSRDFMNILKDNLNICDLDKLNRRFCTKLFKACDLPKVFQSNKKIMNIYDYINRGNDTQITLKTLKSDLPDEKDYDTFLKYDAFLKETFQIEKIESYTGNSGNRKLTGGYSIFQKNVFPEIDANFDKYEAILTDLENLCSILSESIMKKNKKCSKTQKLISIEKSEKGGHTLSTTKTRGENIDPLLLEKHNIRKDNSKSTTGLKSPFILNCSEKLAHLDELIGKQIENAMIDIQNTIRENYSGCLQQFSKWMSRTDVFYSFATLAIEFNLKKPIIIENEEHESFIKATAIRNLLVENVLEKHQRNYIPNDVLISPDESYLLFGCNSSGKSTLLRAIVQSVVLSQCGCFVPATNFEFYPFAKVFVRLGNNDDELNLMSSFTKECSEINQILENSNKNSLVVTDECCNSSETTSATAIVASVIECLAIKRSSFIFATHFFQLLNIPSIQNLPCLKICHLKVYVSPENTLVFERILSDGPGIKSYGILVCKKICKNKTFLKRLERNSIKLEVVQGSDKPTPNSVKLRITNNIIENLSKKPKISKYNKNIIVESCQICQYSPNTKNDAFLEVHHLTMQCKFKNEPYIEGLRRDASCNLTVLCRHCHNDVHKNKIEISGYTQTENGNSLNYQIK